MDSDDDGDDIGYDDALVGRDDIGYDYGFKRERSETDALRAAHKRLNDYVGRGRDRMGNGVSGGPVDRHDSIEYLAPGASGRAVRKVEEQANKYGSRGRPSSSWARTPELGASYEYEAGVLRQGVAVKVQANNLGLGLILELAPHDGNVVIDIWEQGGISKFHSDIRPGDILCQVRKLPQGPEAVYEAWQRDGRWAVSRWGTDTTGWIDCRHKDISKVLRDNMLGTQQLMEFGVLLEFGVLRLSDSEERADTSQVHSWVQAATSGAL